MPQRGKGDGWQEGMKLSLSDHILSMAYSHQADGKLRFRSFAIWAHSVGHGNWSRACILLRKAVTISEKRFRVLGFFACATYLSQAWLVF